MLTILNGMHVVTITIDHFIVNGFIIGKCNIQFDFVFYVFSFLRSMKFDRRNFHALCHECDICRQTFMNILRLLTNLCTLLHRVQLHGDTFRTDIAHASKPITDIIFRHIDLSKILRRGTKTNKETMCFLLFFLDWRLFHHSISKDDSFTLLTTERCSFKVIRQSCCHFQTYTILTSRVNVEFTTKFCRGMLFRNGCFHNLKRNTTTIVTNHDFSQCFIKIHFDNVCRRIWIDTFIQCVIENFFE